MEQRVPAEPFSIPPLLSVPWQRRHPRPPIRQTARFLSSPYFWLKIEFAFRVALIACLPATVLMVNIGSDNCCFATRTLAITFAIVGSRDTVGQSSKVFIDLAKALIITWPLATVAAALQLNEVPVVWALVYFVVLTLLGVFFDGYTRKMCLLVFNFAMVAQFSSSATEWHPTKISFDIFLGCVFGLFSAIFPFPRWSRSIVDEELKQVAVNCGMCFSGLCSSFWCESNIQRSMNLARIRFIRQATTASLAEVTNALTFEEYEPGSGHEFRVARRNLFRSLIASLAAMERACEVIQGQPSVLERSKRAVQIMENRITVPLLSLASAADVVLSHIGSAVSAEELLDRTSGGSNLKDALQKVMEEFEAGRKDIYYRSNIVVPPELFNSFFSYYLFAAESYIRIVLQVCQTAPHEDGWWKRAVQFVFVSPFVDFWQRTKHMFLIHGEEEVRIVKESMKTSVAMIVSVGFFFLLDADNGSVSGPTIIAFISGSSMGEAVMAAMLRLVGTLFGAIFGMFVSSLVNTKTEYVIAASCLILVFSFFRTSKEYGPVSFYASFVAMSSMTPAQSDNVGLKKMQQNTFAAVIYVTILVFVFPTLPSRVLVRKRAETLQLISSIITRATKLPSLFVATEGVMCDTSPMYARLVNHLAELRGDLSKVASILRIERQLMPQAEGEPVLRKNAFPSQASRGFHATVAKLHAILDIFVAAWDTLAVNRTSPPTKFFLRAVSKLEDVSAELGVTSVKLFDMLIVSLVDAAAELRNEIILAALQVKTVAEQFRFKREQAMTQLLREVVEAKMAEREASELLSCVSASPATPTQQKPVAEKELMTVPSHEPFSMMSPNSVEQVENSRERMMVAEHYAAEASAADIVLPITNQDLEGIHSVSFCVISIAVDIQNLCQHVDDWQQSEIGAL